jgi:hypothetical protein
MSKHNPVEFATALSAKLATRSRHVCAFLGAGIARACGLPDVEQLQEKVVSALGAGDREAFERQLKDRNLEEALTRIRRIAALLADSETFDGLTGSTARALDTAVCREIVNALDVQQADLSAVCHFAAWVKRADYHLPIELFTVNYDLLLEAALESLEVPYFDGFIGTLRARFHTELVEGKPGSDREWIPAFFVRLWKLHGSVNWARQADQQIVRLGQPVPDGHAAAIYPSDTKYEESRRVPFVVLQDRFRRALHEPETLVLIAGYSFGDKHLNELLFDAASKRERSEFIVFCFSDIPEELAKQASTTPNLQIASGGEAILGGVRDEWEVPTDSPPGLWVGDQFGLRDFTNLAAHLARSATREPDGETLLRELVEKAVAKGKVEGSARDDA